MMPPQLLLITLLGTSLILAPLTDPSLASSRNPLVNDLELRGDRPPSQQLSQTVLNDFPATVSRAVLQDISRRLGQPTPSFQILRAESRTWPDGCLGLADPGVMCTLAMVPGWEVVVGNGAERWIYRSDRTGATIKLDRLASSSVPTLALPATTPPLTSTPPLPEQQPPNAQLQVRNRQVSVRLINRTGAVVSYEVIADNPDAAAPQGNLAGRSQVSLSGLSVPVTVNFRRQDGGLLQVGTRAIAPGLLDVTLTETTDLGLDRTTLSIEASGAVFLN